MNEPGVDELNEARDHIHAALQIEAAVRPTESSLLTEWVFVCAWTDIEDGQHYVTRVSSNGLQTHRRSGLLHEGLYGFNEDTE